MSGHAVKQGKDHGITETAVNIGHINLARSFNGTGEHFVALVEALARQGFHQHIILRNHSLARRVAVCDNVRIGPVTGSPVMAYCLLPNVDVVHVHEEKGGQAGLLLTLTRSIPYVLSHRGKTEPSANPLLRSVYSRAASLICCDNPAARAVLDYAPSAQVDIVADISHAECEDRQLLGNHAAAEHLRIYRRAVDSWRVPAMLL